MTAFDPAKRSSSLHPHVSSHASNTSSSNTSTSDIAHLTTIVNAIIQPKPMPSTPTKKATPVSEEIPYKNTPLKLPASYALPKLHSVYLMLSNMSILFLTMVMDPISFICSNVRTLPMLASLLVMLYVYNNMARNGVVQLERNVNTMLILLTNKLIQSVSRSTGRMVQVQQPFGEPS